MPKKLKHIVLKEVYYQLVNTCLIISSVGWRYCTVGDIMDAERDLHNLFGERNYCIICQIKKTFNLDKIWRYCTFVPPLLLLMTHHEETRLNALP